MLIENKEKKVQMLIEEASMYINLLDDPDASAQDREYISYQICSSFSLARLGDSSIPHPSDWDVLASSAARYIENAELHHQIQTYLHADPTPDEYGLDYLTELMHQRIRLEAFLHVAGNGDLSSETLSTLRHTRLHAIQFDDTLVRDFPEIGMALANTVKADFDWALFPSKGFAWWKEPERFIRIKEASFNSLLMNAISDVHDEIRIAMIISACNIGEVAVAAAATNGDTRLLDLVSKAKPNLHVLAQLTLQDGSISMRVVDCETGSPMPSNMLDGCLLRLSLDSNCFTSPITQSCAQIVLPSVDSCKSARFDVLDQAGNIVDRLVLQTGED